MNSYTYTLPKQLYRFTVPNSQTYPKSVVVKYTKLFSLRWPKLPIEHTLQPIITKTLQPIITKTLQPIVTKTLQPIITKTTIAIARTKRKERKAIAIATSVAIPIAITIAIAIPKKAALG